MSDDNKIRSRIRKLLALAGDPAASENEKAVAMQKATALIEEHNVTLGEDDDFADKIHIVSGEIFATGLKLPYHRVIGSWVAKLYDCQHLIYKSVGGHSYMGMNHQVEAAEETFLWVVAQVEDLYRLALKAFDGNLTKSQRAELRASFKDACAARIGERIHRILAERNRSRDGRALVVVDVAAQKIQEMMAENGITKAKPIALREGFGTGAGYNAGGLVKIQKDLHQVDRIDQALAVLKQALASGGTLHAALPKIADDFGVDFDLLLSRYEESVADLRRIA